MTVTLCPAQMQAFEGLMRGIRIGSICGLWGGDGMGKTTVLREAHRELGGAFLDLREFMNAMRNSHPMAMEETFGQMALDALQKHDVVILDDLQVLTAVIGSCNMFYPRRGLVTAPLTALCVLAVESGKRLIIGNDGEFPDPLRKRHFAWGMKEFAVQDYSFLCGHFLGGEIAARLNYDKIFRFAPKLNAHQIKGACVWLGQEQDLDTDRFIDYLRSQRMTSNVNLGEVQDVDLRDLKGIDDVIEALEANIILPLENDELAQELNIKPKRGVLLAGPPGTGKTTVGRALAHRLKSKFFLIDGTFISGTREFYGKIQEVFEAAKHNAPAIIFVDDSDVIFENNDDKGLYRYLLTMLDGLESESAGRVCVMLTAMDVANLPPALIRSGRVELWLETRLPDSEARATILRQYVLTLPPGIGEADVDRITEATEGLTGADLKRLIEDGKILYAYDKVEKRPLLPATDYFLSAIEKVRENKERYAEAEVRAKTLNPNRPAFFNAMSGMTASMARGNKDIQPH